MTKLTDIRSLLRENATTPKDKQSMFFKTGKGEYAAHDKFLGVTVPTVRKIAKEYYDLPLEQIEKLITSQFNEERLLALILLVRRYEKSNEQEIIYQFYMNHKQQINNWNLVDSSAHLIVGAHLFGKRTTILKDLAKSKTLWDRRIAIVSTWYFIRQGTLKPTFEIAKILLNDDQDLIHKATGWMLREAGKQDVNQLKDFLNKHASRMPRTMLRYSIEKFDTPLRKSYLTKAD